MSPMTSIQISQMSDYGDILQAEFAARRARNYRYSLRSFAKYLGMSPSNLSEILRKKHGLSVALAERISEKLGYEPEDSRYFLDLVVYQHGENSEDRAAAFDRLRAVKLKQQYTLVPDDIFKLISNWYHLAILELSKLKGFSLDIDQIAQKLRIAPLEALQAINRLKRAGLVEIRDKHLELLQQSLRFFPPAKASLLFKKQILKMAARATGHGSSHLGTTLVAVNRADIPKIVKKYQDFRYELCLELAAATEKDDVVCLGDLVFSVLELPDEGQISKDKPPEFH